MDWSKEFPLTNVTHLNHAGVGPWPVRAQNAVVKFATENVSLSTKNYSKWEKTETELKEYCKILLNAPSKDDIALVKNTSEGLSFIAYGINWQPQDNIVFAKQEFPSNRVVWESLRERFGVEIRAIDLPSHAEAEDALMQNMDRHTRLLAVSAVQYGDGLRMNLPRLSEACKKYHSLLCIDAIQALGALPFDVQELDADFVVADGHKWLLSPEGIGLFYCKASVRDQLHLNEFGWHMLKNASDYERLDWQIAPTAKRFECGSPNHLGIQAMHASLSLLLEIGQPEIYNLISTNISYLYEKINNNTYNLISPLNESQRSGIATFQLPGKDVQQVFQHLIQANVLCAVRRRGIRFSPHFYTTLQVIDHAFSIIEDYRA